MSFGRYGRQMDVKTTLCAYWEDTITSLYLCYVQLFFVFPEAIESWWWNFELTNKGIVNQFLITNT